MQVVMVLLNKWSNWHRYADSVDSKGGGSWMMAVAKFVRRHPEIDVISDVFAGTLLAAATIMTFRVILR